MLRTIETRLTYDHGGNTGMHCDYPLGLVNTIMSAGHRVEIDRGRWPITLELKFRPEGWALISDMTGQAMTKIRVPDAVELDFREYRWYFYGKLYILEFRFDSITETRL